MPKQEAGNIHLFETQKLYDLIGHEVFGFLPSDEIVKKLEPEVLKDYVKYKLHVYRGENR